MQTNFGGDQAARRAHRPAHDRRTIGVAEVENHLTVDQPSGVGDEAGAVISSAAKTLSDAWLTARVAASLRFDRTVDAERIDASARRIAL